MQNRINHTSTHKFRNVVWIVLLGISILYCDDKKTSNLETTLVPLLSTPGTQNTPSPPSETGILPPASSPLIPALSQTTPLHNAANIPINANLTVVFSKVINMNSVTTNTVDTNCSGSVSLSSDDFVTCVRMNSAPTTPFGTNSTSFRLDPANNLAISTQYKIRVLDTIIDESGRKLSATVTTTFSTSANADITAPGIQYSLPGDGDALVGTNTSFSITFTEAMDATSLNVNTSNTTCSGSIQISDNNFASCKRIAAQPQLFNQMRSSIVKPALALSSNTDYQVKITAGAKDVAGNSSNEQILTFITQTNDSNVPQLAQIFPRENQVGVARNRVFTLGFTEKMNPTSFVLNSANNTCSGTVQISSDNFNTCVRMNSNFRYDGDNIGLIHSFFLIDPLAPQTIYKIRLTNGIQDLSGNAFAGGTQATGFTTGDDLDNTPPTILAITPTDGSVNQPSAGYNVEITFSKEMNPNDFSRNISNGTCRGNIQISPDNFASCVRLNALTIYTGNNRIRVNSGGAALLPNTTYKVRVKAAIRDASDNTLGADFTQTTGFTTAP
ncbi:Ig-like domain-containing protein [Leptospira sp. 201903070]|uniref:Ig-like domain-containing protein n=1 Tax=Leptospira ainlahdjerensis TaxID=2810033 RepID=A0ABS2UCL0_9LEPT|nr:Ig-like domain-containing protein [Leptospira ainlahdjerensis]